MSKYIPGTYDLRVKRGSSGRGLFAYSPIKKGTCVVEYFGRTLTEPEEYTSRSLYLFEVTKKKTIDGNVKGNIAKYINHSCKPNCEAETYKGRVWIMAKRNIKVGEELAYDYGKDFFDEHIKKKGCRCLKCQ
ncbi:MAG: SET domain-containing protein-lysine N-methyltransferase [Patescibacteria group bacterium]|nr:SET domain-containing protein-lysine N-methyltransferase [Patescibacteria group bacterium]